jgi:predicted DNA-binding antitoxin AbrB/MazE fold protein
VEQIEAVYQGGVFKPLGEVRLPENQHVRLAILPDSVADALALLKRMQERQQKIIQERGYFPDSTSDIAEDRMRDA